MDEELQKELTWASGTLVAFLILLVYGDTSEPTEIAIAVGAFAVSWLAISYSVKNLGPGSTSKKDLQKEFQWFAGILVIFLAIVTLIGTTDGDDTAIFSICNDCLRFYSYMGRAKRSDQIFQSVRLFFSSSINSGHYYS